MASDDSQGYKMQKVIEYKRRTAKEWLEMLTSQKILSEEKEKKEEAKEKQMIKFENVEVVGWEAAIRGMRNL